MILDLAQHVQGFLQSHNKPPSHSFYDEMLTNQRLQKEAIDKANQKKLDIQKKKEMKQVCGELTMLVWDTHYRWPIPRPRASIVSWMSESMLKISPHCPHVETRNWVSTK